MSQHELVSCRPWNSRPFSGHCSDAEASVLLFAAFLISGPAAPRLIVRGDDLGYSHFGNEAILKCQKEGIQTSIEVLVPSPWFPEAVKMLAESARPMWAFTWP